MTPSPPVGRLVNSVREPNAVFDVYEPAVVSLTYIDGFHNLQVSPGVVRLDCFVIQDPAQGESPETRYVTQRLIVPSLAFFELVAGIVEGTTPETSVGIIQNVDTLKNALQTILNRIIEAGSTRNG